MYARDKTSRGGAVLADLRRPLPQALRPPAFAARALPEASCCESGNLKQAWTLDDLASMCGIDAAGLAATVERFNEHAAQGRRPRLRAGRVGLQPGARRPEPRAAPVPRPDRRGAVLRGADAARPTSARAAAWSPTSTAAVLDESGRTDRRPVRDRQQHGDGDGPPLPRPRRQHRQQHGVRLPRRAAGRRHASGASRRSSVQRDAVAADRDRPRRALARRRDHLAPRSTAARSTTIAMPSSSRSNAPTAS